MSERGPVRISPSITAHSPEEYARQLSVVEGFAELIHLDFADGVFAPQLLSPAQSYWPESLEADFHLMHQKPAEQYHTVIAKAPRLVIVHAEAEYQPFIDGISELHAAGVKVGLALLQQTEVNTVPEAVWQQIDHVMIFSGGLGHFGGHADLELLHKIPLVRAINPVIEVGWDGGANSLVTMQIVEAGVDIVTVGGAIQQAENPAATYEELKKIAAK